MGDHLVAQLWAQAKKLAIDIGAHPRGGTRLDKHPRWVDLGADQHVPSRVGVGRNSFDGAIIGLLHEDYVALVHKAFKDSVRLSWRVIYIMGEDSYIIHIKVSQTVPEPDVAALPPWPGAPPRR